MEMKEYREQMKNAWRQSPITAFGGKIAENICMLIDGCTDYQLTVLAKRWKRVANNKTNGMAALVAKQFAEQLMAGRIPEKPPKRKTEEERIAEAQKKWERFWNRKKAIKQGDVS